MKTSIDKSKLKILLLENISPSAVEHFRSQGYSQIESLSTALPEKELLEKVADVHFLGIRSRTNLSEKVLAAAPKLLAAGCFCIGTNQVDLAAAKSRGVPIFNAPFSNTRSVAELTIGSIIHLMRGIPAKNAAAHEGVWLKSAENSFEVRGKKLGIVGYGNIGSQLSVLASALGMHVYYFDPEKKLPHGNARAVKSLDELLEISDVLTLHVPDLPETKNMIDRSAIRKMKKGSFLINYARGSLVDIAALKEALDLGHLLGAALDVLPREPKSKDEKLESPLCGMRQVLISPHVGGSTQEAQKNIGSEVAEKITTFSDNGSTTGAVNFPQISLPLARNHFRLLHIHQNTAGILSQINQIFAEQSINVSAQFLQTDSEIGYIVVDIDEKVNPREIAERLGSICGTIKMRVLF